MVNEDFKKLEVKSIADDLSISDRAKRSAMEEIPESISESNVFDDNEQSIVNYFQDLAKEANQVVYDKFAAFETILKKTIPTINTIKKLDVFKQKKQLSHDNESKQLSHELELQKTIVDERQKDLFNFKEENKLIRHERSSKYPFLNWAIVVVIVLFESILNSSFFATGSEMGLLGGLIQAIVITFINAFLAFTTILLVRRSFVIQNSGMVNFGYKMLVSAIVLFTIHFHFFVGHYRDALKIDPENAYYISIQNYIENLYSLIDFDSYILVILGIILFIIMLLDIYKIKDPYPGYGEISKDHKTEQEVYENMRLELLDSDVQKNKDVESEIELVIRDANRVYAESEEVLVLKERLEHKYLDYLKHLENTFNIIVGRYRAINTDMRTTPKPPYFNGKSIPLEIVPVKFGYEKDMVYIEELASEIKGLSELELSIMKEG